LKQRTLILQASKSLKRLNTLRKLMIRLLIMLVTMSLTAPLNLVAQDLWDMSTIEGDVSQITAPQVTAPAPMDEMIYESGFGWGNWFRPTLWSGSFELGMNGSSGNSVTNNLRTGFELTRKTSLNEMGIDLDYAQASVNKIQSQNFAKLDLDYDRLFREGSPWSMFTKTQLLYDEFRKFDLRLVMNGGIGYKWIDTDSTMFKTRFGAGASREFGGPRDEWTPEAVFGMDLKRQLTKRQKLAATFDYYPAWTDFTDYRMVSDMSWEMLLDEANNLSLKLSVLDTYDSTPDGAKANDINYGLLLLWKM
jgi:putative salt-induced outer membrane protein YdiY